MSSSRYAQAFLRPALLQAVLLLTSAAAAICLLRSGDSAHCTALVEFAILSTIVALSAGALGLRYAVEILGLVADYRGFEHWNLRLRASGYAALGLYALFNGWLDLAKPRHDADWVSFSGLGAALAATAVVTLVIQTKTRLLATLPSRALRQSLSEDTTYALVGGILLALILAHAIAPAWWLDTIADALFALVVVQQMRLIAGNARILG